MSFFLLPQVALCVAFKELKEAVALQRAHSVHEVIVYKIKIL